MMILIESIAVLGFLGLLLGIGLGIASKKLAVQTDPRVGLVLGVLPGANCGACGFAGCFQYARAVVEQTTSISPCPVGGQETADRIAVILGRDGSVLEKRSARIHCGGDFIRRRKGEYEGIPTCAAAATIPGGTLQCEFGCFGFGDCVRVCPFGAMMRRESLPPLVDEQKCTGCGKCVDACPRNLIELVPLSRRTVVACSSKHRGSLVRSVCDVGCIGCAICVQKCPVQAIGLEENLAVIRYELCDNRAVCVSVCPTKCIERKEPHA